MNKVVTSIVQSHLLDPDSLLDSRSWEPFRPGIEISPLYDTEEGASAAFLKYQPGASVPWHEHTGWEHILVLTGSQSDDAGHYPAGTLLVHAPGSRHRVASEEGCLVLAIWERPIKFVESS
jgi:anti-sigma factor ChrR (cupin superfamily)